MHHLNVCVAVPASGTAHKLPVSRDLYIRDPPRHRPSSDVGGPGQQSGCEGSCSSDGSRATASIQDGF